MKKLMLIAFAALSLSASLASAAVVAPRDNASVADHSDYYGLNGGGN